MRADALRQRSEAVGRWIMRLVAQRGGVTRPARDVSGDAGDGLAATRAVWEAQARADPLWAVLSEPGRTGRRWDVASFMASGEAHMADELARFEELGGTVPDHALAVDFGSGVGRLSQPLGDRFERVVGIDISPTMVAVARRLNRHGERVSYVLNDRPSFPFLETASVSLVSTVITLQHVPAQMIRGYLEEFFRISKPGAGIIFGLPSHLNDDYLPLDRTDEAVPEAERRAAVHLAGPVPAMSAGQEAILATTVANRSTQTWTQSQWQPINVGNHWLDGDGRVVILDDGRARLPGRLRPGEQATLDLTVRAPTAPGSYVLQVDVVQENVSWFAEHGGEPFEAAVEVRPAPEPPDSTESGTPAGSYVDSTFDDLISPTSTKAPPFQMNAVSRAEIEAILARRGATLLGADEWIDEWHNFTYYVQAGSAAARLVSDLPGSG